MSHIRLEQSILEHWLWEDIPFSKAQSFIDLLLMAGQTKQSTMFNSQLQTLSEGEIATSLGFLATRWGWSKHKVGRFLELLESDNMIQTLTEKRGTHITICDYRKYRVRSDGLSSSRSTNNQLKSNNACLKQYDHLEEADTLLLEDIAVDIACSIAEQVLDSLFWVAWETLLEKPRNEMQDSDLPSEYERIIIVRLIMDCLTDFLTPLIKAKRRFGDKVSLRRLIKLEWRH